MTMQQYDREVMRRLWRGRVRRVGAYIDRHAWTHWVVALAFWASFFALAEFGYSAAHDGAHLADAFLDWLGCPTVEVAK